MMRVADSSACWRILAARARPSMSGMRPSRSDERVGAALGHAVPEGSHGRRAVAGGRRLHRIAAQPLLQDVPVGGVVIDDQHRQVAQHDRGRGGGRLRRVRLEPEAGGEGEGAAPARRAVHA